MRHQDDGFAVSGHHIRDQIGDVGAFDGRPTRFAETLARRKRRHRNMQCIQFPAHTRMDRCILCGTCRMRALRPLDSFQHNLGAGGGKMIR
jgi:hypothetical protein